MQLTFSCHSTLPSSSSSILIPYLLRDYISLRQVFNSIHPVVIFRTQFALNPTYSEHNMLQKHFRPSSNCLRKASIRAFARKESYYIEGEWLGVTDDESRLGMVVFHIVPVSPDGKASTLSSAFAANVGLEPCPSSLSRYQSLFRTTYLSALRRAFSRSQFRTCTARRSMYKRGRVSFTQAPLPNIQKVISWQRQGRRQWQ